MTIEMVPVESSNLLAVGYDEPTATLYVAFKGGTLYAYDGVPPAAHTALMAAESKGKHLNAAVKGVYPYRKLDAELKEAA
jgi:KTSC domain-containing protein